MRKMYTSACESVALDQTDAEVDGGHTIAAQTSREHWRRNFLVPSVCLLALTACAAIWTGSQSTQPLSSVGESISLQEVDAQEEDADTQEETDAKNSIGPDQRGHLGPWIRKEYGSCLCSWCKYGYGNSRTDDLDVSDAVEDERRLGSYGRSRVRVCPAAAIAWIPWSKCLSNDVAAGWCFYHCWTIPHLKGVMVMDTSRGKKCVCINKHIVDADEVGSGPEAVCYKFNWINYKPPSRSESTSAAPTLLK